MSESRHRKKRQQKFLEMNPICCFCGGINSANTIDHVPPQACFPEGYVPENFESPACKACNEETTKEDQIFGLYSLLLNFDESQMGRQEDIEKILKLKQGIINNYPDALPDDTKAHPIHRVGSIIAPAPVAISVPTTQSAKKALRVTCRKLTHALYFRETGKIMTSTHQFLSSSYQPQLDGTQNLTSLFASLLPNQIVGKRSNIRPRHNTMGSRLWPWRREAKQRPPQSCTLVKWSMWSWCKRKFNRLAQ